MKKIFPYIFSILSFFCIGLFAGCGEKPDYDLAFKKSYIEMSVGDSLDLSDTITIKNAKVEDVKFASLDTDIISVSGQTIMAVNYGTTMVTAEYENSHAFMEVKVFAQPMQSDAPNGLIYNEQTNSISWNKVMVKIDNQIQEINSYTLLVSYNGEEAQEISVKNKNYYTLQQSGLYDVKVKCDSIKYNGQEIYNGSNYSQSYIVRKLESPTNVTYNDETEVLSWDASTDVTKFEVVVNGIVYSNITENKFAIDLNNNNANGLQEYKVQVKAVAVDDTLSGDTQINKVAVGVSEEKVWKRLYAPQIFLANGLVTWQNELQGDFHYVIITKSGDSVITRRVEQNTVDVSNIITPGTYNEIALRAISDSEQYLSSKNDSKIENINKLNAETISFDQGTNTISVTNSQNKNIQLNIVFRSKVETITFGVDGKYVWNKTEVGTYQLYAIVKAQSDNEIQSNMSNIIELTNLPAVDTSTLTQRVTEGKYYIEHDNVEGVDAFEYSVTFDNITTPLNKLDDGSFGSVDVLFVNAGEYTVTIKGSRTQNLGNRRYAIPSYTKIKVVRQANLVTSEDADRKVVSWNTISSAPTYEYYINKNGEIFEQTKQTTENQYSYSAFEYGNYDLYVKALGHSDIGCLYLDSLNYTKQSFFVTYTLSAPVVDFDRQTKIVTIQKDPLATNYVITFDTVNLAYDDSQQTITIDLSEKITNAKTYTFTVQASNEANALIYPSNQTTIQITKLVTPTQFSLSKEGVLSITTSVDAISLGEQKSLVTINDEQVLTLNKTQSSFEVKAKFIANTNKVGNMYYLDSDFEIFNITRLETPQKPELNDVTLTWDTVSYDNFAYKLKFTQDDIIKDVTKTENNIDVLSDANLDGIDKSQDFSVTLAYEYQGGSINLNNSREYKFSSFVSEETLIHKLQSDKAMIVTDNEGVVTVEWEASEIEGVNYELKIKTEQSSSFEQLYSGANTSFDVTSYVQDEGKYILRLKITKTGYLSSEFVDAYVERLKNVEQISIGDDETITVDSGYNDEYVLEGNPSNGDDLHLHKIVQLNKVLITIDGQEVTSLQNKSGKFSVIVKLIAEKYNNGNYFYLDSKPQTFNFSRINTLSAPTVNDNQITWTKIEDNNYQLKFTYAENIEYLDIINNNTISTDDTKVQNIIQKLNTNTLYVSVKVDIKAFVAQANTEDEYKLSSNYSTDIEIIKLDTVNNITIVSQGDALKQDNVKVSWEFDDSLVSVKHYLIDLYKDNTLLRGNITSENKFVYLDDTVATGKYYVQIKVIGTSNCINSEFIKSETITRLKAPTNISITENGLLTFTGIENAQSYSVEYYHGDDFKGSKNNLLTTEFDMQELLYSSAFSGEVTIKVRAVGGQGLDEHKTFSSDLSEVYTFTKAKEATVRLFVDKIVAGAEIQEDIDENSTYLISISTKTGRLVKEVVLRYGASYFFEDFTYTDSGMKVDTSVAQTFVIKTVRKVNLQNYVLSNSTSKEVTKLADVENFGFIRKSVDVNSLIYLQGKRDENANKYIMSIKNTDYIINEFSLEANTFEKALDLDFLTNIPSSFTFVIYKQGMINESGTSYINSSKIELSGTKLNANTKLTTQNGKLVWNHINGASDYALRVVHSLGTDILTGFVNNNVHTLYSEVNGKSGELRVNIKAVGNVGTTLVTEDIVLDSTYMLALLINDETGESYYIEYDYECTKLSTPENYKVIEGTITFKPVGEDIEYFAVVDGNEYKLSAFPTDQVEYLAMYSDSMYNELQENKPYNVCIKAKSSNDNIIYSDLTTPLKMKIMTNNSKGTLQVNLKLLSQNPDKYDYTVSEITWAKDTNAVNGYVIYFGGLTFATNDEIFTPNNYSGIKLDAGTYIFRVAVRGNSNLDSDGCYNLNSKYSEVLLVHKLDVVKISVSNGKIVWEPSPNATGYLIYLDGNLYSQTPISETECELEGWSDYVEHKLEIRAVSSDASYMCSNLAEYTIKTSEEGAEEETFASQNVSKLQSPETFEIKDGAFVWNITQKFSLSELLEIGNGKRIRRQITMSPNSISSDKVMLKFEDATTHSVFTYPFYAAMFIALSDEVKDQLQSLAGVAGSSISADDLQYLGWPTLNFGYFETGVWLPSGTYNLYLQQIGDDLEYITSNYGTSQEIYIPYAPRIKMNYENNSFTLSWDKVTIPAKYGITNPWYSVVVESQVTDEEGNITTKRTKLGRTQDLKFNLSECIQNGTLTSEHTKIYVYVEGDNSKVLNGKNSNIIEMKVLNPTTAYVKDGEIYWNAQESASEYLVTYRKSSETVSQQITLYDAFWNCSELDNGVEYVVNIQAIGLRIATTTQATLTGKDSCVGKVIKVYDPITTVDCGVFKWTHIDHATSYQVSVYQDLTQLNIVPVSNAYDTNNYIWYETTFGEKNLLYRFKAIGDLNVDMNDSTIAYVNSNETTGIYGTVLASLQNILAKEGKLTWEIVNNNGLNVTSYKLIFNKVDSDGVISDSEYVVQGSSFKSYEDLTRYAYECLDLDSGKYQVTIQAYYENTKAERIYTYNDTSAYYLMGLIEQQYVFEKYNKVHGNNGTQCVVLDNVIINNGEFSWEYSGELDVVNYNYELEYTSTTGRVVTVVCEDSRYFSNIIDDLKMEETFTLKVRVVPKDGVEDFVSSNYIDFVNVNAYSSPIVYQLNGIKEADILLSKGGDSDSLFINWEKYIISSGDTDLSESLQVKYRVVYWSENNGVTSEKQEIIVQDNKIDTNRFEFDIASEFTLFYQIQVLPLGILSYVPSAFSDVREIKKPKSVTEVFYDEEKMYYYWSTEGTSNDHSFKIRDEVLAMDESGDLVVDESGNPIVVRTYIFITTDNTTNTYIPVELGYHKVSVAVVVRTSGNEGSLTSSYTYYQNSDTAVLVNLFEISAVDETSYGAMGTTDNPYLISNEQQFASIKYRLEKPSYQNSYILSQNGMETKVTVSQEDYYFNFKQICDISNVEPFGMIKDKNEESIVFKGVYDGNYKQLTWNCNLDQMRLLAKKNISLFSEISASGKICNLKIFTNYTGTLSVGGTVSMICTINSGNIDNIILGNSSSQLTIQEQDIFWFGVCNENRGIISRVVNYYNVTLSASTKSTRMGYAGIANKNSGTISRCANYGNIDIESINATVGGIVANNEGTVERCVLKNTTSKIVIPKVTDTAIVYFGGIVGNNASGSISYSYAYTNTSVYRLASNTTGDKVYIAGLVGYSANDKISSSYVYNIIETQSSQGVQIGSVYMFAFIANVQEVKDTYCYCNARTTLSPIGGNTQFTLTEYTNKPSGADLNKGGYAYFVANEINFPTLVWESEFANLWQE